MSAGEEEGKVLMPHHEQQALCTTRLPYRQGRKLTAVKVYTINSESNHLLIFGVPSLKLRQELKALFAKFGKLQLAITTEYPTEPFTENYHAVFETIQAARLAKKMLDTKNFYGGSLHVCYAPELENIKETKRKLLLRKQNVLNRLKNLQKERENPTKMAEPTKTKEIVINSEKKLNMGEFNVIGVGKQIRDVVFKKNKRKLQTTQSAVIEKKFKPCFEANSSKTTEISRNSESEVVKIEENNRNNSEIEIIDCTSTETETITNINATLNYNKFGNEVIRKIPEKPVNKIIFHLNKK